jgi:hypothetical protein
METGGNTRRTAAHYATSGKVPAAGDPPINSRILARDAAAVMLHLHNLRPLR